MAHLKIRIAAAVLALGALLGVGGFAAQAQAAHPQRLKVPLGLKGIKDLTPATIKKWNALVASAKAEGKIVIVASNDLSIVGPFYQAFGAEFGINVTLVGGSPTQIGNRILAERQQGVHAEDIVTAGASTMQRITAAASFEPILPNIILGADRSFKTGWYWHQFPWCDSDVGHVCVYASLQPGAPTPQFYYNTQLVNPNSIKSWDDLLKPQYKGKIVMQNVAQGVDNADVVRSWHQLGPKYFTKLMQQDVTVLPSGSDVQAVNGLARGQWSIAMFPGDVAPYNTAVGQGLPIANFNNKMKPAALASMSQRTSILNQAPDQAAAELYLNWILSPEGQAAFNKYDYQIFQTALRTTVPRGDVPGVTWFAALRTKSIYFSPNHPGEAANSLAWWTQEMQKLGVH